MTLTMKVYHEILNNPGMTLPGLRSRLKEINPKAIAEILYRLAKDGSIVKKGLRGHYEYYPTQTARIAEDYQDIEDIAEEYVKNGGPKLNRINFFTPRQLLEELKRRGYVWDKMWVEEREYVEYEKI